MDLPPNEIVVDGSSIDIDPSAAFPTAAFVAYYRAVDAGLDQPLIGSNIGGGPDLLAETLAGSLGKSFASEMSSPLDEGARSLASRTMYYDKLWMEALDNGCKQFVLLASGLDARAWRLPRHDSSVKIFELDVPRCHAYKEEKLSALPEKLTMLSCTRTPVEVDLSDPQWTQGLVTAGFDLSETSFFLAEGLLMYLPPNAVPTFFSAVSSLMCPGSTLAGCCFINILDHWNTMPDRDVFAKYCTQFTFETKTEVELREMLSTANLQPGAILGNIELMAHTMYAPEKSAVFGNATETTEGEVSEEGKARVQAASVMTLVASMKGWPVAHVREAKKTVDRLGFRGFAETVVADDMNFLGMQNLSEAQKARILELVMEQGFEGAVKPTLDQLASEASGEDEEVDESKAHQQAESIMSAVRAIKHWPSTSLKWAKNTVAKQGYRQLAETLIGDAMNFHGMRDESEAQKSRVLELVLEQGFEATAKTELDQVSLSEFGDGGKSGYMHFVAKKAL